MKRDSIKKLGTKLKTMKKAAESIWDIEGISELKGPNRVALVSVHEVVRQLYDVFSYELIKPSIKPRKTKPEYEDLLGERKR